MRIGKLHQNEGGVLRDSLFNARIAKPPPNTPMQQTACGDGIGRILGIGYAAVGR
jgi:hypothetical protein